MATGKNTSVIIGDEPCPKCRDMGKDQTGNHLICYSNGNKYCNRCGYKVTERGKMNVNKNVNISELALGGDIPERKLLSKFTELFGLRIEVDQTSGEHKAYYAPVHETGTGKLLGHQRRRLPKHFSYIGNVRRKSWQFVGQHLARQNGKFLIIVEGFLDTIAAKQMLSVENKRWSVVGAMSTSVEQQVRDNIEWLLGFDTIVLALDQDEAAEKAIETVVSLLPPDRIRIAKYSENDPCDMLTAGKAAEFVHCLTTAKTYTPMGIISAMSVLPDFLSDQTAKHRLFPEQWARTNSMTNGVRSGEIVVYIGGTGLGKSQLCDEVAADRMLNHPKARVGILKVEHSNVMGLQNILSVAIEDNLKKTKDQYSKEELSDLWTKVFADERMFLIDHGFSGIGGDSSFIGKITALAVGAGCDEIIVDHLHAVIGEAGSDNDDVDALMYKLQGITQRLGIKMHIVMHLRKTPSSTGKSFETGQMPTMDDIKGTGALKQVPDTIIAIARDMSSEDPELIRVATYAVLKNRFLSETGITDKLIFNIDNCKYEPYLSEQEHVIREMKI